MAINPNKRLPQATLQTDRESLLALKTLHDYQPINAANSVEAVSNLELLLRQAEEAEILAAKALESARDARAVAGWNFHSTMLSVKAAVTSQYGADSDEIQSMGLKKKVEYRRPGRRTTSHTPSV